MTRLMLLTASIVFSLAPEVVAFQQIDLQRPGDREFVRDEAGLLNAQDKTAILADCEKLLNEKATPIIVVTINDMKSHGGAGMRIETFARFLFDQWEVGHAELNGVSWNTGILLLVSRNDRKARIELGGGWKHEYDQRCKEIMDQTIIPEFRRGDYSKGIREGVRQLVAMSGGIQMPGKTAADPTATQGTPSVRYQPQHGSGGSIHPGILIGLACLAVFTIVSIARNGTKGLAWILWAGVFGVIGYILVSMMTNHDRRSPWGGGGFGGSGGGFGGGSFGGGFSGGGGASGSW
jgi:uncharacterized protein